MLDIFKRMQEQKKLNSEVKPKRSKSLKVNAKKEGNRPKQPPNKSSGPKQQKHQDEKILFIEKISDFKFGVSMVGFYSDEMKTAIKKVDGANYNDKTKVWSVPINNFTCMKTI